MLDGYANAYVYAEAIYCSRLKQSYPNVTSMKKRTKCMYLCHSYSSTCIITKVIFFFKSIMIAFFMQKSKIYLTKCQLSPRKHSYRFYEFIQLKA